MKKALVGLCLATWLFSALVGGEIEWRTAMAENGMANAFDVRGEIETALVLVQG